MLHGRPRSALEVAVEGGTGDAQRLAERGNISLPRVVEGLGEGDLLEVRKLLGATTRPTPGSGRGEAGVGVLADEVALELGERPEDVED